jgi:hypothetical protein
VYGPPPPKTPQKNVKPQYTSDNKRRRDDRDTARSFSNKLFGDDPDDGESTAPPNMRPRPF